MGYYAECLKKSAIKSLSDELKHEIKLAIAYVEDEKLVPVIGMYAHTKAFKVVAVDIKRAITAKKYRNGIFPDNYYKVGYLRRLIGA